MRGESGPPGQARGRSHVQRGLGHEPGGLCRRLCPLGRKPRWVPMGSPSPGPAPPTGQPHRRTAAQRSEGRNSFPWKRVRYQRNLPVTTPMDVAFPRKRPPPQPAPHGTALRAGEQVAEDPAGCSFAGTLRPHATAATWPRSACVGGGDQSGAGAARTVAAPGSAPSTKGH